MSGFEFTPGGILGLGEAKSVAQPAGMAPGTANVPGPTVEQAPAPQAKPAPVQRKPLDISKPRQFAKELRARLRQVQRELKQLRKLEDEELEIKRLLAALKNPPAKVRSINTARSSG